MKALTTLIATTATLALIAPLANATFDRSLPTKVEHAKVAKKAHHKRLVPKAKPPKPRVLIITGQPLPATQPVSGDDCANTGNNCTDEQLCELWGMNCDQIDLPPTPSTAATTAENQDPNQNLTG